jgi:hypothetical protein
MGPENDIRTESCHEIPERSARVTRPRAPADSRNDYDVPTTRRAYWRAAARKNATCRLKRRQGSHRMSTSCTPKGKRSRQRKERSRSADISTVASLQASMRAFSLHRQIEPVVLQALPQAQPSAMQ